MSNCGLHVSVLVPAFDSLTLLLIAGPRVVPVFNYFEELQAILSFYVLNTEAGSPLPSPSALVFSVLSFVCLFFVVKKSDHPYEWEVTPHCSFGVISWGLWDTTHLSGSLLAMWLLWRNVYSSSLLMLLGFVVNFRNF